MIGKEKNFFENSSLFQGQEHSDDEGVRAGYNSGTDDERSNDAFANLRARSTSPIHTTTKLNDEINGDRKRARSTMSDTDTSGDEDQFMDDEVHEVMKRLNFFVCIDFLSRCKFQFVQQQHNQKLILILVKIVSLI